MLGPFSRLKRRTTVDILDQDVRAMLLDNKADDVEFARTSGLMQGRAQSCDEVGNV